MKTTLKAFFVFASVAAFAACDQSSLLPEASLSGATGTLALSAVHHLHDGSPLAASGFGAKVFVNDLGFRMTLTHGEVHFRSLSLVSSGEDPECAGGNDVTISINGSDDLLGEDLVATSLDSHTTPLASYCSYELAMGLHLEGTWSVEDGAETAFEIETEEPVTVEGIFDHPLHFHEGETEAAKTFSVAYDALFDGIDFETMDPATIVGEVLHNLSHAAGLSLGGAHPVE
jgi:hypothetical protein